MTITSTAQGFQFFEYDEKRDIIFKMHYIGYSRNECRRRFRKMKREQIKNLGL